LPWRVRGDEFEVINSREKVRKEDSYPRTRRSRHHPLKLGYDLRARVR